MATRAIQPTYQPGYRAHDVASAVNVIATPGFLVSASMAGRNTIVVVNATLSASVTFFFPLLDPAGVIATGYPWRAPAEFVDGRFTPPPDLSRIAVMMGISDSPNLGGQWTAGGLYYGGAGRVARAIAHDVPAQDSPVEAAAVIAEIEPCQRSSSLVIGAWSPRRTLVKVSVNGDGGTGRESQAIINDDYSGQPYVIQQITSDGFSLDTAMLIEVGWRYLATPNLTVLGG